MFRKPILALLLILGLVQLSCNLGSPAPQGRNQSVTPVEATVAIEPSATQAPTDTSPEPSPTYPIEQPTETPTQPPVTEPTRAIIQLNPFESWPEEYQAIQVPAELQKMLDAGRASLVPLPTDKSFYEQSFFNSATDPGLLGPFDFERLARFEDQSSFAAVPARNLPETPDFTQKGVMVGLVYDQDAFYGRDPKAVYEVYFFDSKAEIRSQETGQVVRVLERGKDYFWTDSKSGPVALTFFIKNGCWLCWNAGGRTGCLICF